MIPDSLRDFMYPAVGVLLGALAGLIVRTSVLPRLSRLAAKTETRLDDIVVETLRGPVVFWCALIGLYFGIRLSHFEPRVIESLRAPLLAIVILSISWTLGGVAGAFVRVPQGAAGALPSARILSSAARGFVLVIGFLVALQTVGISVAPILTALGVGGLAVGLALQDTLANLFAGFQILVSRQVKPGDFIELATGEQGFVEDITWRNTMIRQLSNNMLIVPNANLGKSNTINYSQPELEQSVGMQVGVSYEEDLEKVERVTIEVARSVQRDVAGAVRTFEPSIRFHTFADSSINFSVSMRGSAFTDNYLMKHEFVKRLHARYAAEGINLPYPQRVVRFEGPGPRPASPA